MPQTCIAISSIFAIGLLSLKAIAGTTLHETQELSLALKQLTIVESILDRAERQSQLTANHPDTRFTFDYNALRADLQRVTTGIQQYLSPSRAQPRESTDIQGDYVRDRGQP